uniref:Choline transporter-like protein n=1 Tax=Gadus morhua TaxID=8049 RepID=A0A8C5A4G5_GADMO
LIPLHSFILLQFANSRNAQFAAWLHGDPRKVLHATDSYGQFCGQDGTPNAKKPILFYFNILKCANPSVLINLQCPTTQVGITRRNQTPRYKPHKNQSRNEQVKHIHILFLILQRCLPDFIPLNGTLTVANHTRFRDALDAPRSVAELRQAKTFDPNIFQIVDRIHMLAYDVCVDSGLLIAAAVSLTFILLLRFTAGLLLWVTILAVMLLVAYGMWYCSRELSGLGERPGSDVAIMEVGFHTDLQVYLQLRQTWVIFLVFLGGIEASIMLMLIFLRGRVQVAITLLREASKATGHIMSSLFYPLITFLLLALFISYWAVTAVLLASSGEAVYKVMAPDITCPYANSTCTPESNWSAAARASCEGSRCTFALYGGETPYHRYLFLLQLFNLLACLWLLNFSLALEQCTLAGAFASYYWARRRPRDVPPCPLFSSFSRAVRYHTGSLAFGSLILSVVQLARILLEYLDEKLRGANNVVARFIVCCLKCCFWCLERFIRYMNRNAYIMVAIYGTNFCTSAREAFFLLMRNVVRVAVLDRVTDFLLFLGKLLIAGGVGVLAFFVFDRKLTIFVEVPDLNFYWVPIVTVFLGSYLIAHGFFSVYAMCVDTLFLCFCEDLERNDGSAERPFFMSPGLHQLLGKSSPSR